MSAILFTIGLLTLGACTLMCCGPESAFPFGMLHRALAETLPAALMGALRFIPGGTMLVGCCSSSFDYVFNKPNPIMQAFYLVLVVGGFILFIYVGLPMIPNSRLGPIHVPLPFILVSWTLFTFFLASWTPPGFVTPSNAHALEKLYPYDGFIFVRRNCSTCGTPRVARSKHCRMLGKCVQKYDHFCPWINTTVGALNFRFFLLFVLSTAVFLVYGTYVLGNLILWTIDRDQLWDVKFVNSVSNQVVPADWKIITQYVIAHNGSLVFIFVLCLVMGITLVCFFLYQLYLIYYGTTSNESGKWAEVQDFYSSDKWKRELDRRGDDFDDSKSIGEDTASLHDRMVKEFPTEMPKNIYNKGFWENMKQVIWPESPTISKLSRNQKAGTTVPDKSRSETAITELSNLNSDAAVTNRKTSKKKKSKKA